MPYTDCTWRFHGRRTSPCHLDRRLTSQNSRGTDMSGWWQITQECYLRHSGLRTIRGGIIWGGRRWLAVLAQHRLLGYHRRKKSFVLRRKPSFFILPNMRRYSIVYKALRTITLLPIGRFPAGLSPKKTKGGLFGAAPAIPTHTGAITATGAAAPGPRMRPNLVGASAPARLTEPCALPGDQSDTAVWSAPHGWGRECPV
jgi:hypothetical protein